MTATQRYANARLTAIRHIPHEDKLILSFDEHEDCEFTGVVDFSLNGTTSCLIYTNTTSPRCPRALPPSSPRFRITSTAAKTGKFSIYRRKRAWAA